MPPELAAVRAWLTRARHDWLAAQALFTPGAVVLDVIAFHCQQAVEKTLKAFLVSRGIEFEKTHDLGWLLDLCVGEDPGLDALREALKPLSAFAVAFRYPGPSEPTRTQVAQGLAVVRDVWEAVTRRLPPEVIPDLSQEQ